MRAILDEMLPPVIADQLRERGHDVVAVAEQPGLRSLADPDIFATAQAAGRAIVRTTSSSNASSEPPDAPTPG